MLEYLNGKVQSIANDYLIIEVGGIGFKVNASKITLEKIGRDRELPPFELSLPVHLNIQESKWELFGFSDNQEKEAFLLLINCRGIGPRAGLNILSSFTPGRLKAIALGEEPVATLQQAQGVGAKSAERIFVELKEKLPQMHAWSDGAEEGKKSLLRYTYDDLYRALTNLGYRAGEIQSAISNSPNLPPTLSDAIKELLKIIGGR